MANFRKSFNFRNGVQVDEDNFIVNSAGLVGIGTSVPTETLDVRGSLKVVGVATIQDAFIGVATVTNQLEVGITSLGSGIIAAKTGIVTYYGDARYLQGMPTSQWVDVDAGLGYTSIYASGNVGVGTTDPRFTFQVGGNNNVSNFTRGVGINSSGDVKIAGILTVTEFYGYGIGVTGLNASTAVATGNLHNDRLPSNINKPTGIITASTFVGNLTGVASTAQTLTGTPNIVVGVVTASKIVADTVEVPNTGITTVSKLFHVGTGGTAFSVLEGGKAGVGTAIPSTELQIVKESGSVLEVISEQGQSIISVGQSVGVGNSNAVLRFGNSDNTLDLINNDTGDIRTIIHDGTGAGSTGNFKWVYGQTNGEIMTLTYDGKLGIGEINPEHNLHVVGTSTITSDLTVGGNLDVSGTITGTISFPELISGSNLNNTAGITTLANLKVTDTVNFGDTTFVGLGTQVGVGTAASNENFGLDVRNGVNVEGGLTADSITVSIGTITANNLTSANGFRSSDYVGSKYVQIDYYTSPDRIVFNVVGIGSTTLNLF